MCIKADLKLKCRIFAGLSPVIVTHCSKLISTMANKSSARPGQSRLICRASDTKYLVFMHNDLVTIQNEAANHARSRKQLASDVRTE